MYNDIFDKELIDYLSVFFQSQKVEQLNVTSFIVGENIYQIRFENEEMVLQFFYEKEDESCEAQIRITNILLKGKLKNKGLSKNLLNNLIQYCHNHGEMSLWIYELINQSWKNYLVKHGARIYQEESLLEGAALLICDEIK
jgi:GNAT superfamily N-acetyltransferase